MTENITDNLKPKTFHIIRQADESGVSGTGKVLDGVLFPNGKIVVQWRTDLNPLKAGFSSMTIFDSFNAFESIHVDSHPTNKTLIVWDDDVLETLTENLSIAEETVTKQKDKLKELRKELRELKETESEPTK